MNPSAQEMYDLNIISILNHLHFINVWNHNFDLNDVSSVNYRIANVSHFDSLTTPEIIKYIWEKSVEKKMDYYHDMYGNLTSLQIEFGMEHKAKVRMAT